MPKPKQETTRVAMMFPVDLKNELQELAGPRNLTNWVIDACQERLSGVSDGDRVIGPKSEINEARKIAQKFADIIANSDEDPNPQRILQEMDLPDWLTQDQWPEHLRTKPVEVPEPEPEPESDWVEDAPVEEVNERFEALGPQPTAEAPVRRPVQNNDLLAKVMAKADELGISKADFKMASELPVPPKPPIEPETAEEFDRQFAVAEPVEVVVSKDLKITAVCEKCGSELVDGECWTCMF